MHYRFLRFPDGKPKAATFSYDDGVRQDIRLSDLFTRYGLKATFNLNDYNLRGTNGLSPEEVEEHILKPGHEIAVHGFHHRAPGKIRPIEGIRDVLDCRLQLEKTYGRIIRGMAYPDSGVRQFCNDADYDSIRHYLQDLDIVYSRSLGKDGGFMLPTDWYCWMPTAHHKNPQVMEFLDMFIKGDPDKGYYAHRYPTLMYIWGHSYEFDNDNNWEVIEEICQKLSAQQDVWFATNMEIYEYVQAYNSLVYSADNTMVYNPSLQTVWFDIDSTGYAVQSGQTLRIEE